MFEMVSTSFRRRIKNPCREAAERKK
ncbi:transmembrane protein 161B, isoform CRA_a [Mus musculus]|nr:transmembrane protein 161B, isoform CRA_a [Mus musculus]EDL37160.1 transmembrane protein 161B, isoform CRA_a [Mus musculus]